MPGRPCLCLWFDPVRKTQAKAVWIQQQHRSRHKIAYVSFAQSSSCLPIRPKSCFKVLWRLHLQTTAAFPGETRSWCWDYGTLSWHFRRKGLAAPHLWCTSQWSALSETAGGVLVPQIEYHLATWLRNSRLRHELSWNPKWWQTALYTNKKLYQVRICLIQMIRLTALRHEYNETQAHPCLYLKFDPALHNRVWGQQMHLV